MLAEVENVVATVKARFVEAANRGQPEHVMPDVATLMTGTSTTGDPTDFALELVIYAHGLHEAAKTARQHGQLRQADTYYDLAQVLLAMAAESVGGLVATIAHLGAVKH